MASGLRIDKLYFYLLTSGTGIHLVYQAILAYGSTSNLNVGDYMGQIGLSPPAAYPSTVGHRHIQRFPCTWALRPCTRKLPISLRDSDPTDRHARIWANPKERRTITPTLALLLLTQIIWMIKHEVEHVKIMTHKLYASPYIMIITGQLYSSHMHYYINDMRAWLRKNSS